jgi:F0F1-type ATP synthase membrane subunit b/b'
MGKRFYFMIYSILLLLVFSNSLFPQGMPEFEGEGPKRNFEGRENDFIPSPEISLIIEKYRIKIQKVFLDAKANRLELSTERKEISQNLMDLAEKYKTDKTVSKGIVDSIKKLNLIHQKIQDLNQDAMKKIEALNLERRTEIKTAFEAWSIKLENDSREMERFVEWILSRPYRRP